MSYPNYTLLVVLYLHTFGCTDPVDARLSDMYSRANDHHIDYKELESDHGLSSRNIINPYCNKLRAS